MSERVTWVVQSNLGSDDGYDRIARAVDADDSRVLLPMKAIPFDTAKVSLPAEYRQPPWVFYGAVNFIERVRDTGYCGGVFGKREEFSYEVCKLAYGRQFINSDAVIYTVSEFAEKSACQQATSDGYVFVRPVQDTKQFAGEVIQWEGFSEWCARISAGGYLFDRNTRIAVARPKTLYSEWRLFFVGGLPVASCQYREMGRLVRSDELAPRAVQDFAVDMSARHAPNGVAWVMDVAKDDDGLGVLELNGFNSSGFYGCDVNEIVQKVSDTLLDKPSL